MMENLKDKTDSITVPAGYMVAGTVGTTPIWVSNLSSYLELIAVLFAVLVGATTLWINVINLLEKRRKKKRYARRLTK